MRQKLFLFACAALVLAAMTTPVAAAPLHQQDDWARVKAAGKILVGTSADYPPFEMYDSNSQLDGFDIALFKAIGKQLGVEVEFNDFAFDGLLTALRLKQVDAAIGAISVTPDRRQLVDFTNIYYVGEDAALARSSFKGAIRSITDLAGQTVGVERGTTYQQWVQKEAVDKGLIAQSALVPYDDVASMVRDVRSGKISVAILGRLIAEDQDRRFRDLKIAGSNFNKQQFAIATRQGSTLVNKLNEALVQAQADGTFARLVAQYLQVNPDEVTPPDQPKPPTPDPATPQPEPSGPPPCEWGMQFVADLNLDDKNMTAPPVMQLGQEFNKGWRLRNVGTCAWESDFQLAYIRGNRPEAQMSGSSVSVGRRVEPGQTVDLSVRLRAPNTYGVFQGFWQMRTGKQQAFGEVVWVGVQIPDPNPPPPPPPQPGITPNLRADSAYINQGQCTAIRWDVDDVNAVFFIDGGNAQGVGGHDARTVCPANTTTYTLRVTRRDNTNVDFPITINVVNVGPVSINFWVDQSSINAGQCATLRWDVQNAQAVFLNQGAGEAQVGGAAAIQICPRNTTTYSLRVVRRDGGQETRQLIVNVSAAPQPGPAITGFTVDSNRIPTTACANLRWNTTNASSITLNRNGAQIIQGANSPSGAYQDCGLQPGLYEYVLNAFGNGQTSQRLTVEVVAPLRK